MDIAKSFELSMLYDMYGALLTEKQRSTMDMYLNLDYSLSEIAEITGATRQAALDSIKRAEQKLREYECALGVYNKYKAVMEVADEQEACGNTQVAAKLKKIWEDS